ncbi:MAG: T9SS type A sorting domain-containing protein [Flavobacteriales bacterium]|nr:T9SS type A sorting domain-containing protein [Flavobacteriales bacterium]
MTCSIHRIAVILTTACVGMSPAKSQLTITNSLSTPDVATLLEGLNVVITNLTINCPPGAMGHFSGSSEIPITDGLILSTGMVDMVAGPNASTGDSYGWNTPGDPDLGALVTLPTYDACVLEFDCQPLGDTLLFNFAFGSEEYLEWVGSGFNDVFAIWLSGPGFPTPTNVATIPGGTVVSVNNVNTMTNPTYYVNNETPPGVFCSLDGFTQNLTVFAVVVPGATYHFKIAVADVSDMIFDTVVMLEAFSFRSVYGISTAITSGADAQQLDLRWRDGQLELLMPEFTPGSTVRILDAMGRVQREEALNRNSTLLDVTGLSAGGYIVQVVDGATLRSRRFVKD